MAWGIYFGTNVENSSGIDRAVSCLVDLASAGVVTLLFDAHDVERNNAADLREYLASL
jgi:hypothetical protein